MRHLLRPLSVLLIGVAVATAPPRPAAAHGGTRVLDTTVGPYRIEASVTRAGDMVDETISVVDVQSGRPVTGAAVAVTLEGGAGGRIGPLPARPLDGAYEVRYPLQDGGSWTVVIEVHGPDGSAEARHPYQAPDDGGWGGRPGLLLNLLLVALLVAAVLLLPRLGRSRRDPAPPPDTTVATRE